MSNIMFQSIQQLYKTEFENFLKKQEVVLTNQLDTLLEKIANNFSIDYEELHSFVYQTTTNSSTNISSVSSSSIVKVCQHQFTSGKNKGQNCGEKVCLESKTGLYCKTHVKKEDKNMFLKDVSSPASKTKEQEVKKESEPKKEPTSATKAVVKKEIQKLL